MSEPIITDPTITASRCAFCDETADACRKRAPAYCCANCLHLTLTEAPHGG